METTSQARKFLKSKSFTLIILFVIIAAFFSIISKGSYFTLSNLRNVLNAMVLYILLAIAEGVLIIFGEIDLSPGYFGTTCGVFIALLTTTYGLPWYIALVLALALGAGAGLFNAVLINEFGFQSFIATLATGQFIAKGMSYVICGGKTIPIKNDVLEFLGSGKIGKYVPAAIIIALVLLIFYGIMLSKTKFGRSIYLCGGNRNAARLSGLNPRRLSYILYANSGALGALAGIIYAARMKGGNLVGTNLYAFQAITAAILGGISFGGGSGGMFGCFLGLLVINSFSNGLVVMQVSSYWQSCASGVLLLIALSLDYLSTRNARKVKTPRKAAIKANS
jgi:ribose/xylose/arabinose/galactoside ABC-type transport system permease subunit